MNKILIVVISVLLFWQVGFAQNDNSHVTEQTINDGYGNYFLVPAGKFSMGDNYNEGNPRERPVHPVYLDTYYIGEYEITNKEYKKFIDEGGYDNPEYWVNGGFGSVSEPLYWNNATYNGGSIPGNENFPVVGVSWYEAKAYCTWLSAKTGEVYRLPTEAEWEKAARGGDYLDGDKDKQIPNPINPPRRYPWGNEINGSYSNYIDSGDPYDNGLTPVGYYDGSIRDNFSTSDNASPYGAYDMAGNVYEWCNDPYGEDYYQACLDAGIVTNPQGPATSFGYVIRGSAFLYETFKHRSAYRGAYYPSAREAYIGIRCVREISVSSIDDTNKQIPGSFMLYQNNPNPFNPLTTIHYQIPETSQVSLKVYSMNGNEVAVLISDEVKISGHHNIKWDGENKEDMAAASGIYICWLKAGNLVQSRKMTLLR